MEKHLNWYKSEFENLLVLREKNENEVERLRGFIQN